MKFAPLFTLISFASAPNSFAMEAPPKPQAKVINAKSAIAQAKRYAKNKKDDAIARKKVETSFKQLDPEYETNIQAGFLVLAARNSPEELARLIHEEKLPTSFSNKSIIKQPIFAAFHSGNKESVTILLEAGVDLNVKYRGVLRRELNKLFTLREFIEERHLPSEINVNSARKLLAEHNKPAPQPKPSSMRKAPLIVD